MAGPQGLTLPDAAKRAAGAPAVGTGCDELILRLRLPCVRCEPAAPSSQPECSAGAGAGARLHHPDAGARHHQDLEFGRLVKLDGCGPGLTGSLGRDDGWQRRSGLIPPRKLVLGAAALLASAGRASGHKKRRTRPALFAYSTDAAQTQ